MNFYVSELLKKPVYNKSDEKIGTLSDIVIVNISRPHPLLSGIVIKRGVNKEAVFVPAHDLATFSPKQIKLTTDIVDLTPYARKEDEVLLVNEVYDKQIVDIDDRRLTRVNDLLLEQYQKLFRLKGVDVSVLGIFKRLKLPNFGGLAKANIVDWEDVQFLGGNAPVKFNVQYKNLESLHPVDIGRIIFEGPGYKHGSKVLSSLKDPIAADIIEELSPILQKNLIESMKLEDVADVIEHMPPNKAADLLLTLGPTFSQKIIPLIKIDEARAIQSLLNYPEHTTGAYMTTDYLVIPSDITVDAAIKQLRDIEELPDFTTYVYVLENKFSNKLVGIIAMVDIVAAESRSRVSSLMQKKLITTSAHENIKNSLKLMYRYNLSALPVVNNENKLQGILTFRDAITIYLPKRWKNRIRQVFSDNYSRDNEL